MCSGADQGAVLQHKNLLRVTDGGSPLRDDKYGGMPCKMRNRAAQRRFGLKIKGACAVVQNQNLRAAHQGARNGEALLLPSVMLNYDGLFLDGLTVSDVERELGIKVITVPNDGAELKKAIAD